MPAAILIVLLLASIAVDFAHLHLARHEALDTAADAANDAVTVGLDQHALHQGSVRLDPVRADRAAGRAISARRLDGLVAGATRVTVDTATGTVTVTVSRRTTHLFGRVVPGDHTDTATVTATATVHQR